MDKIASFKIDHTKLFPGLYVSGKDVKSVDLTSEDIFPLIVKLCDFVIGFEGEIPGAKKEECGNYSEQNLNMTKYYMSRYKNELIENKRFEYQR